MRLYIHKSGRTYLGEGEIVTEFGKVSGEGYVKSSTGEEFLVTSPLPFDLWRKVKRGPQITHWKDLGMVVALTGLSKRDTVVEYGTGTGFSTIFFALLAREVISFERNPRHYRLAKENVERMGLDNVELVLGEPDVVEDAYLVFSDIPEPWRYTDTARRSLIPGGFWVSYLPTIPQVERMRDIEGFTRPEVYEVIVREWKVDTLRPKNTGLLHTAFLVVTRNMKKERTP